jgi:hypothetical protein
LYCVYKEQEREEEELTVISKRAYGSFEGSDGAVELLHVLTLFYFMGEQYLVWMLCNFLL